VEVTPKNIRLRKQVLNPSFRKKRVREDGKAVSARKRKLARTAS
jgi:hypothetical protein